MRRCRCRARRAGAVRLQQADREFFAEELRQVEIGQGTQGVDVETEQGVDGLEAVDRFDGQRFGQATVVGTGQGEQARMLAQAGAGQRGDVERDIHRVTAMAQAPSRSQKPIL